MEERPVPPEEIGSALVREREDAVIEEVAMMLATERLPEKSALPCTESACAGEVLPIPNDPEIKALSEFGSNQYFALLVPETPPN
jgi:hypothetical protein